jgi:hypothetical protein
MKYSILHGSCDWRWTNQQQQRVMRLRTALMMKKMMKWRRKVNLR